MSKVGKSSVALNIVLVIVIVAASSWFLLKYRKQRSDMGKQYAAALGELADFKKDPSVVAQVEARKYIDEVNKVYDLPKGETPIIGTVVDDQAKLEQLKKENPFFINAQPKDVTLIYKNAKIAIIYRPSTKQLVSAGPVSIQDQQSQAVKTTP